MDLLRSRKFRVLVMGVGLLVYLNARAGGQYTDWCMVAIALLIGMYMLSVSLEDGLSVAKYP